MQKRDLDGLVGKNLLILVGADRGAYYQVPKKWSINGPNGPKSLNVVFASNK